jgi:hypothetical protein
MATMIMQRDVREAINRADELSRSAHENHHEPVAQVLDSLRTALMHADEALGGGRSILPMVPEMARLLDELAGYTDRVGPDLRASYHDAIASFRSLTERIERDLDSVSPSLELPAKPLLGVLPLARVIPQDVHSMMDYAAGGTCLGTALWAESSGAKAAGAMLGASAVCVSLLSDYRLSVAKLIPIEAHEAIDHIWGATAIAAPFVFGYWKKDPAVAAIHILTGASTILASLFTDYRAAEGVGRSPEEIDAALRGG